MRWALLLAFLALAFPALTGCHQPDERGRPPTEAREVPSSRLPALPRPAATRPSLPRPRLGRPDDPYAALTFAGWRVAGPTNWDGLIARAARDLPFSECDGIPAPVLLKAWMMQESSGIPWAVSVTGYTGLMQLGEEAAAQVGVTDRLDPRQSLRGGVRYGRWLWSQWTAFGRTCVERVGLMLRSYVVGIGTMLDVQGDTGAVMPVDFDPHLSAEGREYEPKIRARIGRER